MSSYIFICLSGLIFVVNSLLHLFLKKFGNITKALIMPSIFLCCLAVDKSMSPVLIGAIATSWLGDVLLEKNGFRWFTAGGISFMASHMLYGLSYIPAVDFENISLVFVVPVAVLYAVISFITVWNIRKTAPENSFVLLLAYLFTNAFMNILAFMQMLSGNSFAGVMIYIGAILFFISDNCLFIECFHRKRPNLFFTVMSTYILGEFLIAVGSVIK